MPPPTRRWRPRASRNGDPSPRDVGGPAHPRRPSTLCAQEVTAVPDRTRFNGTIRYYRPERAAGLAVVDVPGDVTATLGGLKQMRVRGALNGTEFTSNTMPAGGGVLALSV